MEVFFSESVRNGYLIIKHIRRGKNAPYCNLFILQVSFVDYLNFFLIMGSDKHPKCPWKKYIFSILIINVTYNPYRKKYRHELNTNCYVGIRIT